MPTGPEGQKRPAGDVRLAVKIARIATGEDADDVPDDGKDKAAQALGRKGGKARAEAMTPERRAEIAKKGAALRLAERLRTMKAGAIAFTRTGDPETGDWDESHVIANNGRIPPEILAFQ